MQHLNLVAVPLTSTSFLVRVKQTDINLATLAKLMTEAIMAFCCAPAEAAPPPPVIAAPAPAPAAEEVVVRRALQQQWSLSTRQAARLRTELWLALK